jgi:hypothetical protein
VKPDPKDEKKLEEHSRQAAMNIQKVWRGYIARRRLRKRVVEEMVLIGMLRGTSIPTYMRARANEVEVLRREQQEEYQAIYERQLVTERQLVSFFFNFYNKVTLLYYIYISVWRIYSYL